MTQRLTLLMVLFLFCGTPACVSHDLQKDGDSTLQKNNNRKQGKSPGAPSQNLGASRRCRAGEGRSVHPFPKSLKLERRLRDRTWKKKRLRTELLGLSLQDALISIAEQTKIPVNASPDLAGIVTVAVKGMRLVDVLGAITRSNDADWRYDRRRRMIYVAAIHEGAVGRHQILSTYVTKAKFHEADAIVKMIQPSLRHFLSTNNKAGLIKVAAPNGIMARIYDAIDKTDRQPAQVLLDLSIYEVDHSETLELGRISESTDLKAGLLDPLAELSRASGRVVLGAAASNIFFSRMRALSRDGKARIVSAPKAIVVDGKYAEFMTTETLIDTLRTTGASGTNLNSGFTTLKEVSLRTGMKVQPVVVPGRRLMLHIQNAESSSLSEGERFGVKNHRISTNVIIRSGRTLLLGGAIYEKDSRETTGVPFLKDLWVIGSLFSQKITQKKRVKIIFSIRPEILTCKKKKVRRYRNKKTHQKRGAGTLLLQRSKTAPRLSGPRHGVL